MLSCFYKSTFFKSMFYKSMFYKSTFYKSMFYKSTFYKSMLYKSSFYKSMFYKSSLHLKISAIFLLVHKTYISIILAQHLLVTTILIILGSIIIKTLFPSLVLKFGTAFPKAIEDYQSTYSKRKFRHYYL